MLTITPLLNQAFVYPQLDHALNGVLSPAIAVRINRVSYRAGYLPNYENDQASFEQIVDVGGEPLIADTAKIWITAGLQLITFPVAGPYALRLELPAWYQEVEMEISAIDGLSFPPGSSGLASQAGLNAAIAQINATLALKAAAADVAAALALKAAAADVAAALALKADLSALPDVSDFISTVELVQVLALKADAVHSHDGLYYPRAQTYTRAEVDTAIAAISGGGGEIAQDGLIWAPDFTAGAGSTLPDTSGYDRAGSFDGAVEWSTRYGRGLQFDGGFVNLSRPDDPWIDTGEFSIEMTYLNTSVIDWAGLLVLTNAGDTEFIKLISSFGANRIPWTVIKTTTADNGMTDSRFLNQNTPSQWRYVSVTCGAGQLKLYEGLELVFQRTYTGTISNVNRAIAYLGWDVANGKFSGTIADARLYNRVPTHAERRANFLTTRAALLADGITL